MTHRRLLALIALICAIDCGCTPLAAWRGGNLAKPQMALSPNPAHSALRDHLHVSRQAASGGAATAGGGCDCN